MDKIIVDLLNALITGLDKLLTIVNSWRRLLLMTVALIVLISLMFSAGILYKIATSEEVAAEFGAPQVERVSGWCYQQRVRSDRRIVAIQFPIADRLVELGVQQNLVALVLQGKIDQARFNLLCNGLLIEISQLRVKQLYDNPALQQKLQEFYQDLDDPGTLKPFKKSDIEKDEKTK